MVSYGFYANLNSLPFFGIRLNFFREYLFVILSWYYIFSALGSGPRVFKQDIAYVVMYTKNTLVLKVVPKPKSTLAIVERTKNLSVLGIYCKLFNAGYDIVEIDLRWRKILGTEK